jgi:hypothetical protein
MLAFVVFVVCPFHYNLLYNQGFTILAVMRIKDTAQRRYLKPYHAVALLISG